MASNPPPQPPPGQQPANQSTSIVTALGNAFKTQSGDLMSAEQIAQLLIDNIDKLGELARQGKLTQRQITQPPSRQQPQPLPVQLPPLDDISPATPAAGSSAAATATAAFKTANPGPFSAASPASDGYPITGSQTPVVTQQSPVQSQATTALENAFQSLRFSEISRD
ncbi:hypothetical protein V8D89_006099 [Ganoderma adspersum]